MYKQAEATQMKNRKSNVNKSDGWQKRQAGEFDARWRREQLNDDAVCLGAVGAVKDSTTLRQHVRPARFYGFSAL